MKIPQLTISQEYNQGTYSIENLEENSLYESCVFTTTNQKVRMSNLHIKKCHFDTNNLESSSFTDCIFENCDFSNFQFDMSSLHRCQFKNCKFMAASLYKASLRDTLFTSCMMTYLNFSETKSVDVGFKDCLLQDSSFQRLNHKNLSFDAIQFGRADFLDTKLKGIDLSRSDFESLLYTESLSKGLIVRMDQGFILLAQLGIVVE